jgi:site-specific DNA-methyltransferase (adenine-specific)
MIIHGDSQEEIKKLEENSIDTIITDPPYGLSFMGKKWDYDVPSVEFWKEALRVLKPGGTLLTFAGSRTQHRMAVNVEDAGFELKDCIMWLYGSGFPKATDISKQLDKGHKRGVIGIREDFAAKATRKQRENICNAKGFVNPQDAGKITEPATPEAKLWNGWKSHGLKPAYEPILVAMKPNDGTYANNALKHGVSGLNIDGGRIGTEEIHLTGGGGGKGTGWGKKEAINETRTGRFPANIILDEDQVEGEEWRRYFYCAKASKKERNAGCEDIEPQKTSDGREKEADNAYQRGKTLRTNHHPTVKPLALMEYLCTLTKTPTGGVVLDPFAGSGTTGVACKNTGRDFILIEREEEYIPIIKARLNNDKS